MFKQFECSGNTTQLDKTFGDSKGLLICKTSRKSKSKTHNKIQTTISTNKIYIKT